MGFGHLPRFGWATSGDCGERNTMGLTPTQVKYVATVFYPGPIDRKLDLLIDGIARVNRGTWASSGYNFVEEERSMAYSFTKEETAQVFGREAVSTRRGVMTTRVDTVHY
jgi:hypothetical protein